MKTSDDRKATPTMPVRREDQKAQELIQRILLKKAQKSVPGA
jgi:hypothetical protein